MNDDGSCPRCGADLDEPAIAASHRSGDDADSIPKDERTPWHFKLMVIALVVYLGYRFIEIGIKIFT